MFQVASKIKNCRLRILDWNRKQVRNATKRIQEIKREMDIMKEERGSRDWNRWHELSKQLNEAYKDKETY